MSNNQSQDADNSSPLVIGNTTDESSSISVVSSSNTNITRDQGERGDSIMLPLSLMDIDSLRAHGLLANGEARLTVSFNGRNFLINLQAPQNQEVSSIETLELDTNSNLNQQLPTLSTETTQQTQTSINVGEVNPSDSSYQLTGTIPFNPNVEHAELASTSHISLDRGGHNTCLISNKNVLEDTSHDLNSSFMQTDARESLMGSSVLQTIHSDTESQHQNPQFLSHRVNLETNQSIRETVISNQACYLSQPELNSTGLSHMAREDKQSQQSKMSIGEHLSSGPFITIPSVQKSEPMSTNSGGNTNSTSVLKNLISPRLKSFNDPSDEIVNVNLDEKSSQEEQQWLQGNSQALFVDQTLTTGTRAIRSATSSTTAAFVSLSSESNNECASNVSSRSLQNVGSTITNSQFQDFRENFHNVFNIPTSQSTDYQFSNQTGFTQVLPPGDYRDMSSISVDQPVISTSQQMTLDNSSLLTTHVDNPLPQGYSLVYHNDNQMLSVDGMIEPEFSASQSALTMVTSGSANATDSQSNQIPPMAAHPNEDYAMLNVESLSSSHITSPEIQSKPVVHSTSTNDAIEDKVLVQECDTTQDSVKYQSRIKEMIDKSTENRNRASKLLSSNRNTSGLETMGSNLLSSISDHCLLLPPQYHSITGHEKSQEECVDVKSANGCTEENSVSSSGIVSHQLPPKILPMRKSKRLEENQQMFVSVSRRKQEYKPEEYDTSRMWCEECMMSHEVECPAHRLIHVPDKIILSPAWASLPNQLQIFRVQADTSNPDTFEMRVCAKRQIPKLTKFGPYLGELVDTKPTDNTNSFLIMIETQGVQQYFSTKDEYKCNWMTFIRPAETFAEQNLVAYQHKGGVFFSVMKTIEAKQELKVWYAAPYAARLGMKPLHLTEQDKQNLDEENARFPCFECDRKFHTSVALQQHLQIHDSDDVNYSEFTPKDDEFANLDSNQGENEGKQGATNGKQRGRRKTLDSSGIRKKKSSSMYINKTIKKYRRKPGAEKSFGNGKMYKRQDKSSGENVWTCTHCYLTFNNPSSLNLHTLTHAAEDICMEDIDILTGQVSKMDPPLSNVEEDNSENVSAMISSSAPLYCPECNEVFTNHLHLMNHVETHAKTPKPILCDRPFKCRKCSKAFSTSEKLEQHQLVHGDESNKPLQCTKCSKRFVNNSALACHLKIHSDKKYYICPVCDQDFDVISVFKEHTATHMDAEGRFPCNKCVKVFEEFSFLRKHIRTCHVDKVFDCQLCGKEFPRLEKLKLHMLRHTNHREFMCETCGRQFKRKDKLQEHRKNVHCRDKIDFRFRVKEEKVEKKFAPKVLPTEYHRFIYKCHTCLLGFKRRGMLVNHLAKRHPAIKPEQVPELNLPILKIQRDFYCQYCDKIYKSSSKRKAHILKVHPGCELPPSTRKKMNLSDLAGGGMTFAHTVSSITTMPHGCQFCYKQYASKAKLLKHQRKNHPDLVEPMLNRKTKSRQDATLYDPTQASVENTPVPIAIMGATQDGLPNADLLTQAMSELHSYPGDFSLQPRLQQNTGTAMIHIQSNQIQPGTIDISQLSHALQSFTSHGGLTTVIAQAPPSSSSPTQQSGVAVVGGAIPQTINIGNAHFLTRSWTSSATPSHLR